MKLVQANIFCGKLGYPLVEFVKTEAADIVCMQEVSDLDGHAGPLFHTLAEIKEATGYPTALFAPVFDYPFMSRTYRFGLAVMTRLPVASSEVIFTRGAYKANFDITKDDINIRNFQHVMIEVSGKKLHVINHHGHYVPGTKAGNSETLRQMEILARYIDTLEGPIIVCGDFNLSPDSTSIAKINERLINLPVKFGVKNTYSDFHKTRQVCDYIFVNQHVGVKEFEASDQVVSDHKALILEFEL